MWQVLDKLDDISYLTIKHFWLLNLTLNWPSENGQEIGGLGILKLLRHQDLVEVLKSRNITVWHCDQVTPGAGRGWAQWQPARHEMMKVRTKIFMIASGSDHWHSWILIKTNKHAPPLPSNWFVSNKTKLSLWPARQTKPLKTIKWCGDISRSPQLYIPKKIYNCRKKHKHMYIYIFRGR